MSFEDGPEAAERILREYARWRLGTLPVLPNKPENSEALLEGYRRLDENRLETGRRYCSLTDGRLITTRAVMRNKARVAWALWDIVHRHLVAVELGQLKAASTEADELTLVLQAEQAVERLAARDDNDE